MSTVNARIGFDWLIGFSAACCRLTRAVVNAVADHVTTAQGIAEHCRPTGTMSPEALAMPMLRRSKRILQRRTAYLSAQGETEVC
jgi:hypothetical protein